MRRLWRWLMRNRNARRLSHQTGIPMEMARAMVKFYEGETRD